MYVLKYVLVQKAYNNKIDINLTIFYIHSDILIIKCEENIVKFFFETQATTKKLLVI